MNFLTLQLNTTSRCAATSIITAFLCGTLLGRIALAQDTNATTAPPTTADVAESDVQPEPEGSEIPLEEKEVETIEQKFAEIDRLTELVNERILSFNGQQRVSLEASDLEYNDPLPQRQRLIWRLYEQDPTQSRLSDLMHERWRIMTSRKAMQGYVPSETAEVMRNGEASTNVIATATYWSVHGSIRSTARSPLNTPKRLLAQAERFTTAFPDDPRGASLLGFVVRSANDDPGFQMNLLSRLATEYPESFMGKIGKGKLRQMTSLGKPLELEFEDFKTGEKVTMESLKGKVVVLDFISTFCRKCMKQLPGYMDLQAEFGDDKLVFIMVSLDRIEVRGGKRALGGMLAETGISWPVFYMGSSFQSEFSLSWGIDQLPAYFIIDQEGNLRSTSPGNDLEKIVRNLLKSEGDDG